MSSYRNSNLSDQHELQKLFQTVRDHVVPHAHFNWSNEMIEAEFKQSSFFISEAYQKNIEAFIAYRAVGDQAEIMALGVHPNAQRQGVMQKLLYEFAQLCRKNKQDIYLEVHSDNTPARTFYDQFGFKTQRIRKGYYSDGADAIVMHFKSI